MDKLGRKEINLEALRISTLQKSFEPVGSSRRKRVYGSCWGNEINWVANGGGGAVQNTWYPISDADMTSGELANVTHDGSGKLTATFGGTYLIEYTVSMEASANNKHYQTGLYIKGAAVDPGTNHFNAATANEQFFLGGNAIYILGAGDTVEVCVRTTDTGTPTITVDHLNLTIVRISQ